MFLESHWLMETRRRLVLPCRKVQNICVEFLLLCTSDRYAFAEFFFQRVSVRPRISCPKKYFPFQEPNRPAVTCERQILACKHELATFPLLETRVLSRFQSINFEIVELRRPSVRRPVRMMPSDSRHYRCDKMCEN